MWLSCCRGFLLVVLQSSHGICHRAGSIWTMLVCLCVYQVFFCTSYGNRKVPRPYFVLRSSRVLLQSWVVWGGSCVVSYSACSPHSCFSGWLVPPRAAPRWDRRNLRGLGHFWDEMSPPFRFCHPSWKTVNTSVFGDLGSWPQVCPPASFPSCTYAWGETLTPKN